MQVQYLEEVTNECLEACPEVVFQVLSYRV
jgi:hypothetical protein